MSNDLFPLDCTHTHTHTHTLPSPLGLLGASYYSTVRKKAQGLLTFPHHLYPTTSMKVPLPTALSLRQSVPLHP